MKMLVIKNKKIKLMLNFNKKSKIKKRKNVKKNQMCLLKGPKELRNRKRMRKKWRCFGKKRSNWDNLNSRDKCLCRILLNFKMASKVKLKT
jgi:hypothetical protein